MPVVVDGVSVDVGVIVTVVGVVVSVDVGVVVTVVGVIVDVSVDVDVTVVGVGVLGDIVEVIQMSAQHFTRIS